MASCSSCSSSCTILASRVEIVALNFDFTDPSSSCSLAFSSLFCLSSCCRAFSLFWAALRSPASSELSVSTFQRRRIEDKLLFKCYSEPPLNCTQKHKLPLQHCQQGIHLQCGLSESLIEKLHVALLFLKLFLQLCNTSFQPALLVQQR